MGIPVLIIGKSGSGKSASMRNFQKEEVGIINVVGKPLPFRNDLNVYNTDDYIKVKKTLIGATTNTIVIDDAGYLMTNSFMKGHSTSGSGNAIFAFYNKLADEYWGLITFVLNNLPADKVVYFMMHEDKDDDGEVKPKSLGKLLDGTVCLEGLFTIVLRCKTEKDKHLFGTKTDGLDVAKTPMGMFDSQYIDNDLKMVDDTIREYYGLKGEGK